MNKLSFSYKNRNRVIGFVVFSIIFILGGIPSVYEESILYGSGYFVSITFFKTILVFIPFVLYTIYCYLYVRHKYVLIFDDLGLLDQRYLFKKYFFPWEQVSTIELHEGNGKNNLILLLFINTKNDISESISSKVRILRIPLKQINCNLFALKEFFNQKEITVEYKSLKN